ncbi:putative hydrolase [Candidatus Izimaplasma bacterium HR1]|jgi:uncharacterized protein|uniref:HD domain-containing protein n=1 Tax=Candidatus Izimoplasma sp. HR1 TaxID=1541959 RepID=UPI0004F91E75|nr:putative hydrolase [Candidatus Izimaplasma bacterium HR1]
MSRTKEVEQYAREKLITEITAHDFEHTLRVLKIAVQISKNIDCDLEVVQVASLTHDIIDKKVADDVGKAKKELLFKLSTIGYKDDFIEDVFDIIENMSFSSGRTPKSIEGKIVQDADRIDAIGAIAIARTFAYGGSMNRKIYEEGNDECSIAHFYDKLLLLKDRLNTKEAKEIAESRHKFMVEFSTQFHKEWKLEDIK